MNPRPDDVKALGAMAAMVERTLARAYPRQPAYLGKLLRGLIVHWGMAGLRGRPTCHPGIERMTKWSGSSRRTTQTGIGRLRDCGAAVVCGHALGGRGMATDYRMDLTAVWEWLEDLETGPSASLARRMVEVQRAVDAAIERAVNRRHTRRRVALEEAAADAIEDAPEPVKQRVKQCKKVRNLPRGIARFPAYRLPKGDVEAAEAGEIPDVKPRAKRARRADNPKPPRATPRKRGEGAR